MLRYLQTEVSPLSAIMYKADSKELGSDIVCGRRQSVLQQIVVTIMSVDLFNFWKEVVSKTAAVAGCESTCIKINPLNCNLQGSLIMFVNCIFFYLCFGTVFMEETLMLQTFAFQIWYFLLIEESYFQQTFWVL